MFKELYHLFLKFENQNVLKFQISELQFHVKIWELNIFNPYIYLFEKHLFIYKNKGLIILLIMFLFKNVKLVIHFILVSICFRILKN